MRTTELSPAQRTAMTARIVLTASVCGTLEAMFHGSIARIVLSAMALVLSGGLLAFAKRAD